MSWQVSAMPYRLLLVLVLVAAAMFMGDGSVHAQVGYDRPGGDYRTFAVRNGDPAACAASCEREGRCLAWTFSYPRTERTAATCWLKSRVTPLVDNDCCVSGVRGASLAMPRVDGIEFSIDRFGGDYRNLEVAPDPKGAACEQACKGDRRCRAWTYARPGYIGPKARCFLKNRVTRPRRAPCCISGVVR
jgi:hypothetical protein